jgi:SAM-dependent methyltransferase
MNTNNLFKELNKIVEEYKKSKNVYAIILRGSLSRGDYDNYSDIDLTFIINKKFKNIRQGVGKTNKRVSYGFRFIEREIFYNQEWSMSMKHAYQFSLVLYSKLDDLESLIMQKCRWKENERLKCLSKHVVNAQFCFPFFNFNRKIIPSEFIKARKRGFNALSLINIMDAIENLCSILCILNGIFPPERKLYWTNWLENCIDYVPSKFSLIKLNKREELIAEFNKNNSSKKLLKILRINYIAIDKAIKDIWNDYEFDYYEYFLDAKKIKKNSKKDRYTAKIVPEIFNFIDRKIENVLDLGCGTGRHIRTLRDLGIRNITGVDKSKSNLLLAKKRGLGNILEIDLNKLDKESIEGKFDLIIFSAVFSYLNDLAIKNILSIINSKLREGGYILFTDFIFNKSRNDYTLESSLAKLDLKKEKISVYHRKKYQITDLFKEFKIIKVINKDCLTFNEDYHPYIQILFKRNSW